MRDNKPEAESGEQDVSKIDFKLIGFIADDLKYMLAQMQKVNGDPRDATVEFVNYIRPFIQAAKDRCDKELEKAKGLPIKYQVSANGCLFSRASNAHLAQLEFIEELKRGLEKKGKMPIDIEVKPW